MDSFKRTVEELIRGSGITVNGSKPWDIKVHDDAFYRRVIREGSLGLGESYMDGWWECRRLDEFFNRIFKADIEGKIKKNAKIFLKLLATRIFNFQSRRRAYQVAERHYDLDNDLFRRMLDKSMTYSCGYWKNAKNLDEAQKAKLDLVCRKANLKPGMKVLDIGCGWGSFAKYAAEKYKVEVTGITVSKEQARLARQVCKGLPVKIVIKDYREIGGKYDAIVSIAMLEAVGHKNLRTFMKVVHRCLKDDGIFVLHTIGNNTSKRCVDPWTNKYIFPNGAIPSMKQLSSSVEKLFMIEDIHNFGHDYDKTLMVWHRNFQKAWPELKQRYDDRFKRMWEFYLLSCAASFRSRNHQLWQLVLTKHYREQPDCRIS